MIPYHPDLLKKIIATSQHLIAEVTASATQMIAGENIHKKELEDFLFKVDAVNFLAGIGVGIGALTAQGARGAEMTAQEALIWLAESRVSIASGIATQAIPSPTAPRKDFKFWVRHTLGPWNPSFWASVVVAIQEGDADIYLYGADATAHQTKLKIKQQADSDIARLTKRIDEARHQMGQSYYNQRI